MTSKTLILVAAVIFIGQLLFSVYYSVKSTSLNEKYLQLNINYRETENSVNQKLHQLTQLTNLQHLASESGQLRPIDQIINSL